MREAQCVANRHSPIPPKCRPIAPKQPVFSVFHSMGLQFGGHTASSRGLEPPLGGNCTTRGPDTPATRHKKASCSAKTPIDGGVECTSRPARLGRGAHGQQRHHRLPNFARNLSCSFFETPQKQCNSNDANSMFEQVAGELRAKLMGGGGAWPGFEPTYKHTSAHPAPLLRRAPEGPEGLAALPVGGGGSLAGLRGAKLRHTSATRPHWCGGRRRDRRARAGFEIDHSERSSRVAISRAAGPSGARNTRGATSSPAPARKR